MGFCTILASSSPIDPPSARTVAARAVNQHGQVVGVYDDIEGIQRGFLYDRGVITLLDVPDALGTMPVAINDRGLIIGTYDDDSGTHGFLAIPTNQASSRFP